VLSKRGAAKPEVGVGVEAELLALRPQALRARRRDLRGFELTGASIADIAAQLS
jgi:hypothetical protein